MKAIVLLGHLTALLVAGTTPPSGDNNDNLLLELKREVESLKQTVKDSVGILSRQLMLQQLFVEERVRSDGDSGIKQIRGFSDGTRPYLGYTFTTGGVAAIHEHANYDRTVGLGEMIAVLNGVEFRTRHNDYKLRMPSTKSKDYHATENVPFPPVPPSVLNKRTVQEQIAEMRQYFKAFHNQDKKIRDYTPYFKPTMCYLEGGWTTDVKNLEEPFQSDRHFVDAKNWKDLQDKIIFTAAGGGKSPLENLAFLPVTVVNVTENGMPVFAQWNYRIMCHPIKTKINLKDFGVIDDLPPRMLVHKNMSDYGKSKTARFFIAPNQGYHFNADDGYGVVNPTVFRYGKLDSIMAEIPGKGNYPEYLTDDSFHALKYRVDLTNMTVLNTARYHRWYRDNKKGAMGLLVRHRGFADSNLFVAETKSPRIAKTVMTDCEKDVHNHEDCQTYEARYTYAIPLEIIWLNPLYNWNPYNLTTHNNVNSAKAVTADHRDGGLTKAKAFNGTSFRNFYRTPVEFFSGSDANKDPADTAKDVVGVLDQSGEVKKVTASGTRIFLPNIDGVGRVRIRYPVMPVHAEGNVAMKNTIALQDIMMNMKRYSLFFETRPEFRDLDARPPDKHYVTSWSHKDPPGRHQHDVYLPVESEQAVHNGTELTVYTSENNGHSHVLKVKHDPLHPGRLLIVSCDDQPHCWDLHNEFLFVQLH